jgi:hypothetical protein
MRLKKSVIPETRNKLTEVKSILQYHSNLTDNEIFLLVDGLGHKVAAYSNKAPLSINTQEKSFTALKLQRCFGRKV